MPLLIVNGAAVYGQLAYAYDDIAPDAGTPARLALSVLFAAAVESIAVYVGWHAHDALLSGATATAARLRRAVVRDRRHGRPPSTTPTSPGRA